MNLICKSFSIEAFKDYVENLKFNGWTPNFIVVHNTSVPNQQLYRDWHKKPTWTMEGWLKNLASYYASLGWKGCPHAFVGYDRIGVLNDLTIHGTHTPSWNKYSWGVETVAEFQNEPFDNGVKDNLVSALATLHSRIGLNPADFKLGVRGLHFHKEDVETTHKDCPGKNLVKSDLINDVVAYMNKDDPVGHPEISIAAHTVDTNDLSLFELTDISWLQLTLNKKRNAGLRVDGKLGDKTKEAVKDFQKFMKLKLIDGIAGPVTRKALKGL